MKTHRDHSPLQEGLALNQVLSGPKQRGTDHRDQYGTIKLEKQS
jgi:hypothetical protein